MKVKITFNILVFILVYNIIVPANTAVVKQTRVTHMSNAMFPSVKTGNLKLETRGHNWLIISWNLPVHIDSNVVHHIYRNKVLIAELGSQQSVYKDTMLRPNHAYLYEIYSRHSEKFNLSESRLLVTTLKNTRPELALKTKLFNAHNTEIFGSHIHTFKATDNDNDRLYYNIDGVDSNNFIINQHTGELITKSTLAKGKIYELNVQVSDGMEKNEESIKIKTQSLQYINVRKSVY
jgi:hypothetical protein